MAKKSQARFFVLILTIVAIGIAGFVYSIGRKPAPITLLAGIPLPEATGYLVGDPNAPVTILQWVDFECPVCANFANVTEPDVRSRIVDQGLANLRIFDYPMPELHPNTMAGSLAAACANEQGKFLPMHDALFRNQLEWAAQATSNPRKVISRYLSELGIDAGKWNTCYDEQKYVAQIESHRKAGVDRQVGGTPSFVIGEKLYPYVLTYDQIKHIVDSLGTLKKAATATPGSP